MRKNPLVTSLYYHIYNRGVDKRDIFMNKADLDRFVFIVCYCFNPNHFHFILKQEVDGGISEFFKRLLGGYTKYFNLIHNRSGALFQGRFKSNLIDDDAYFLKIRPYVHLNYLIHEIPKNKSHLVLSSER